MRSKAPFWHSLKSSTSHSNVSTVPTRPLPLALWPLLLALCALNPSLSGCQRQSQQATSASSYLISFETQPSPPRVGNGDVVVRVTDVQKVPVQHAKVEVEGTMAHAGMKSSFATLREENPGQYKGTLEWTMGGDWIAIVRVTPAGASAPATHEQRFEVRGVVGE